VRRAQGSIAVFTFKDGLLARAAHDLAFRLDELEATLDAAETVTATIPLRALAVVGPVENGVVRSMGRRATCFDNAVAESFFATYKKELIHTRPWNDITEVRQHTFLWIESYYNRRRRHSTLKYLTPTEYELGFRELTELAA